MDAPLELEDTETFTAVEGDGGTAEEGEQVLLHLYVGNARTGEKAASTYDQSSQGSQTSGQPVALQLSDDQVFPTVVKALVGVPSGSRVVVAATPEDAYGTTGAAQLGIKAGDDVVFVVDLVATEPATVLKAPQGREQEPEASLPDVLEQQGKVTGFDFADAAAQPPSNLQVVPLIEGTGPLPARTASSPSTTWDRSTAPRSRSTSRSARSR